MGVLKSLYVALQDSRLDCLPLGYTLSVSRSEGFGFRTRATSVRAAGRTVTAKSSWGFTSHLNFRLNVTCQSLAIIAASRGRPGICRSRELGSFTQVYKTTSSLCSHVAPVIR